MNTAFDAWIGRARNVSIEREIERRGIQLNGNKAERCGPCPRCGGDDRFSINVSKQVFNCRGCDKGGDVIALVEHLDGVGFVDACTVLTGEPPPRPNGKDRAARSIVAAEFKYESEDGSVAFVVERVEYRNPDGTFVLTKAGKRKKSFRQKRPDPDRPGAWIWNVDGVPALIYRLPELIAEAAGEYTVLVVEGEAKVDLLRLWNVPATCCAGGAKKWKAEHAEYLRNADVVLVPDNDESGWKHANEVGASLAGIASRVRVLVLPDLPQKGDIIDWAKAGGTREQLDVLVEQAPEWQPPGAGAATAFSTLNAEATAREDELLTALANMPDGVAFARQRKKVAKDLGVRQDAIDAELEARRGEKEAAPLHGHWIVEPWPEPVDGDSLLRDIVMRLRRHVVLSADDALGIALWVMLAWVHDSVATHSPILDITSAEPESGKSTTLGLVSLLTPRCLSSVEISEAALYRSIELWRPTFAIDEFDSVLSGTDDDRKGLRSVINSGHTRGQGVVRCVGDDKTPQLFPTFCAKAIGMNGRKLPAATLSRCIIVELRRRRSDEPAERFEHKDDPGLADLRRRLFRWSLDNDDTLRTAKPSMPAGFDNRRGDNWRIMVAIADLCSGPEDWGDKARLAATRLEAASDVSSIGVRLLGDIKRIFDEDGGAEMLSAALVSRLKADQEGPWSEWGRGKDGLTQNSLAALLGGGGGRGRGSRGGFGIRSVDVHKPTHGKGYRRAQFEDAWARYLPAEEETPPSTDTPPPPPE